LQNINLYLPELQPNSAWLTERSLIFSVIGFISLLVVITVFDNLSISKYEKAVVHAEQDNTRGRSEVEKIKAQRPSYALQTLDNEIARLRSEIDNRQRVIALIDKKNLGNVRGYSKRLYDLAAHSTKELSVQHIRFSEGSSRVDLSGFSRRPESAVNLIGTLQKEESYARTSFGVLTVTDMDFSTQSYQFSFGFEPLFEHQTSLLGAAE